MKKKLLLLWVLVPMSCMTSYLVYAQSLDPALDPLDSEVVAEDPVPVDEEDLISWDDTVGTSEEDLISWEEPVEDPWVEPVEDPWVEPVEDPWVEPIDTGDEAVASGDGDESVASQDEVPTDSAETPILGGFTGLGGLESALPTTDTDTQPTESSTSDQLVSSTTVENQPEEPVDTGEEPIDTGDSSVTSGDSDESVASQDEVPTDSAETPILGGFTGLGGLESALPTTDTDTQPTESSTSDQLVSSTSTDTSTQSESPTSNQTASNDNTPAETQPDEPVLASTNSSDLIAPSSTDTSSQTDSSTNDQAVNSGSSTSQESNQSIEPTSSKTDNNHRGTSTPSKTTTTQSNSTKNSGVTNSSNQSSSSSTSSKNSVSSTTKVNKPTNNTSHSTVEDNSVADNQEDTSDNSDQSQEDLSSSKAVQDKPVVTTEQNDSTTKNETRSDSDNSDQNQTSSTVNKDDSSSETNPVSPSHAQQEQQLDESDNEPEIQTTANEDENKLTAPKPSPNIEANEESETTQVEINEKDKITYDPVVIIADNSVLPQNTVNVDAETVNVDAETVNVDAETFNVDAETFNVDAEIGPHQVFLIDIGEGYSKPTIVEHLNNSQVFIKGNLLTYVPNLGFSGIDTFSYQVIDPKGKKVVRQVRVKVIAKAELVPVRNCQLYFVNDEGADNSQFLTVSPTGKTAIKLGPEYYTFDIEGSAIDPTTGLLYATSSKGRQNIFDGYLYRVNPESGGVTIIGDTGFSEISSLAFNPKDNSLWSWARKGSKDKSKPSGLIKIDPTTAQSQLVFSSKVDVEGLAWDSEGKILYGAENTRLWAFDGQELHQQCANFSSEVESLETSVNGLLLFGASGHNGNSVRLYDPATCEELVGDSFAIPSVNGNFDIETIAWSLECQAAMTKTTRSNKVTSQPATTCPSDTVAPCPTLEQEEIQQFFTDNLKADFVQIEPDGLAFVSLNGELHSGFFSYSLSSKQVNKLPLQPVYEVACKGDDSSVARLKLSLTKDVDGDGHNDFVINYCDGQAQMLFYLGINDTDDIEDFKKKNSSSTANKK